MAKPFKFRYVYEITGAFVFIAVSLLLLGTFFAARIQGWFEPVITFHTVFSTKVGAFGLEQGGDIIIMNTRAGYISSILPNRKGFLEAELKIKQPFSKFVREDSVAVIKKKFALAGDAYLEIVPGDFSLPVLKENSYLESSKDMEIMETVNNVLDDFRKKFMPALEKLKIVLEELPSLETQSQKTLKEAELFLKDLRETGIPAVKDIQKFVEKLPTFSGKIEKILNTFENEVMELEKDDTPLLVNLNDVLKEGRGALLSLNNILDNINKQDVSLFIEDLPKITKEVRDSLTGVDEVLNGVKKHWLLRKYVKEESTDTEQSLFFEEMMSDEN